MANVFFPVTGDYVVIDTATGREHQVLGWTADDTGTGPAIPVVAVALPANYNLVNKNDLQQRPSAKTVLASV